MPLGPELSCRAHFERYTKSSKMLIVRLTCTSTSAVGPKNMVLILQVCISSHDYLASLLYTFCGSVLGWAFVLLGVAACFLSADASLLGCDAEAVFFAFGVAFFPAAFGGDAAGADFLNQT